MSLTNTKFIELEKNKTIFYTWFEAMHTRIDIVLCDLKEREAIEICHDIKIEIQRIENIANRFDTKSELAILNMSAAKDAIKVSDELYFLTKYSLDSYFKSNGLFDITVNSHNHFKEGIKNIELIEKKKSVRFLHKDIQIDLGGISKGYALDMVVGKLKLQAISDFLINFGNSSIAAFGNHSYGHGWLISDPNNGDAYLLHNEFLSVSGNNTINRKHIINPHTQKFIEGKSEYAVKTSTGIEGEVLSTSNFIRMTI